MDIYLEVIRNGEEILVPFCELVEEDVVTTPRGHSFTVGVAAHRSDDPDYDGWLCYDSANSGYFPEDFI